MSMINKFFNAVSSLGDDSDAYDDEFLEDEFGDDYDDEFAPAKSNKINFFNKPVRTNTSSSYENTNLNSAPVQKGPSGPSVRVIQPTSFDEGRAICDALLEGSTVILNVEGLDLELAQRIIDFTSGSTYSIEGHLQKISSAIFLVTPQNVDITGDLQNILNSSFDVASLRNRY